MKSYKMNLQALLAALLIGIFFFIPVQATADPNPDINVNGSDGPITVDTSTSVTVSVAMDSGTELGEPADWFIVRRAPDGSVFSVGPFGIETPSPPFPPIFQGDLVDFPETTFLTRTFSEEGTHTYFFAVDQIQDGALSFPLAFDSADIIVKGGGGSTAEAGEYGDAPDGGDTGYPGIFAQTGSFPTLFSSNGARTMSVDDAILGDTASIEMDADDAADPDGVANLDPANTDTDDGLTNLFLLLTSIPPPATVSVEVNGPAGGSGGTFFLNVLIDLDMDGSWGGVAGNGEPEWVVKNHAVTVTSGSKTIVTPPAFAFANGLILPDGAYMRIALTKESVTSSDWDGSGEFSSGEIEDHVIKLPEMDGKKHPILAVDCGGPYRFGGAPAIPVTCNVTNLRRDAGGTFNWTVRRVSGGGVDVNAKAGGPVAVTAAPGPGNAVAVGLNATRIAGNLPSTWRFTAVPDPEAVLFDGGIILGHGESAINFDFDDEEPVGQFYIDVIEGGFQHFDGFSEVKAFIHVNTDNPDIIEGAVVAVELLQDGRPLESKEVKTDAFGNTNVDFTIFNFGNYTVRVVAVEGNGGIYNPEHNIMDSVNVNVN